MSAQTTPVESPAVPTLVRLRGHELAVSVPLDSDAYDTTGKLLLRRGQIVASEALAARLIARGVCRASSPRDGSLHFPRGGMPTYGDQRVVRGLVSNLGMAFEYPPCRMTGDAPYVVQGAIARESLRATIDPEQLWPDTFALDEAAAEAAPAAG